MATKVGPYFYQSGGGSTGTLTAPTKQLFTSASPVTGYLFSISGVTTAPTAGATYTNNSVTYTVIGTTNTKTLLWATCSGAQTFSGTTLTKATGTGDSTITFVNTGTSTVWVPQALGTYTTPGGAIWLKITAIGAGGGGGGTASTAAASGAGGGGGGGGAVVNWLATPSGTYYYVIGAAGFQGPSGNNAGGAGAPSGFGSGTTFYVAFGGVGGNGSPGTASTVDITSRGGAGGSATGGDININGSIGAFGVVYGVTDALGGVGGTSGLGFGTGPAQALDNAVGGIGLGYGGGGGGAAQVNNGGAANGGAGAAGVMFVEEFYE